MAKRLDKAERSRREREVAARARTVGKDGPSTGASARPRARPKLTARLKPFERRQATSRGVAAELGERIAWAMLAAVVALVGAGLALAVAGAIVPSKCPPEDASCSVGWMLLVGMLGYLLALLPACAIGGLGIWFWVAYFAGFAPLLMLERVGDWWWWAALVVLPAAAAAASAPLGRATIPRPQRFGLLALAGFGLVGLISWYASSR